MSDTDKYIEYFTTTETHAFGNIISATDEEGESQWSKCEGKQFGEPVFEPVFNYCILAFVKILFLQNIYIFWLIFRNLIMLTTTIFYYILVFHQKYESMF